MAPGNSATQLNTFTLLPGNQYTVRILPPTQPYIQYYEQKVPPFQDDINYYISHEEYATYILRAKRLWASSRKGRQEYVNNTPLKRIPMFETSCYCRVFVRDIPDSDASFYVSRSNKVAALMIGKIVFPLMSIALIVPQDKQLFLNNFVPSQEGYGVNVYDELEEFFDDYSEIFGQEISG